MSEEQRKWLQEKVRALEAEGRYETETAPQVVSPVNFVKKGDGWRFTVDFKRTTNPMTLNSNHPLPLIVPLLQTHARGKYFGKIDLTNGFWNLKAADEETKQSMGFHVPEMGYYVWEVLAQGLKQGPSEFQRFMDRVLEGLPKSYIDDIIISADTEEEFVITGTES